MFSALGVVLVCVLTVGLRLDIVVWWFGLAVLLVFDCLRVGLYLCVVLVLNFLFGCLVFGLVV